ncbi:MAG: HPr family phosphocarrier protein [Ruminiclostridium sp.]|nr:HPr family phosphocarrier protein [Ruminiclostridium sp.]
MTEFNVKLSTINDVKIFVNTVMRFNYDIDLISGRYAIDAKSIMGIFSVDLDKELKLIAHTDDASELKTAISDFIVGSVRAGRPKENRTP